MGKDSVPRLTASAHAILTAVRRWLWLPVSGLLLAFVVWRTRPWELGELLGRIDPASIILAVGLNALVIALWAIRSRTLMAGLGHPLPLLELVPVVAFANTINNLTPASSGEALRAWILRERHGVAYRRSVAVILAERLWAIGLMAVSAAAVAAGPLLGLPPWAQVAAFGLALAGAFLPLALYRLGLRPTRLVRPFADRPGRIGRLCRALIDVDDALAEIVGDPRQAVAFVATTGLVFVCFAIQLGLIVGALGSPLGLQAAWAALGLATVAGVLSALPFGLGATDIVLVALLAALGVPAAMAGAATLLLRATATLPLGIAGTLSWAYLTSIRGPGRRSVGLESAAEARTDRPGAAERGG
jgi:uncharacterized protein (TIRG00374 family)